MTTRRGSRWTSAPTRPALPYYGSKWRLSSWIRSFIPPHQVYCEPFGGSASLLLRKEPAKLDVFNDLDDQVVNFFRVLRDEEDRRRLCALLELTPYAKTEFTVARLTSSSPQLDRVERARELFVRGWQGYGPGGTSTDRSVGWARSVPPSVNDIVGSWLRAIPNLEAVANRLRLVQIEHDSAWNVFDRYDSPETLFYVDPPYVESTLTAKKDYRHGFTEADHRRLAEVLRSRKGMVLLSGFDCELYQELFSTWQREERRALTVGRTDAGRSFRTECLWMNHRAVEVRSER